MTEYGPLTEKEYYTLSERNCFTKAEDDIYDGRLKICDIPFEYRSLRMYRVAYRRYPYSRVIENDYASVADEITLLENQILNDIKECEDRYRKNGNLSKEYPWYLLRARVYCLKRLLARGVIEGVFRKEKIIFDLPDYFPLQNSVTRNKDVVSFESVYNVYESMEDYIRAKNDLLDGRLKIYKVPFEYRSRVFYIMAGRFVAGRGKTESDLLKKTILDDAEESAERFWKYGNLSKRYPCPDLLLRKAGMKNIMIDFKFYKFFYIKN